MWLKPECSAIAIAKPGSSAISPRARFCSSIARAIIAKIAVAPPCMIAVPKPRTIQVPRPASGMRC